MPAYIGSPLGPHATRVLVLGGGELGKGLAKSFQNLGLEVHVADRYEGAPAQQVAHFSYTIDFDDPTAVLELAHQVKPHYIVPEIENISSEALQVLASDTPAMVVPTARACDLTSDRKKQRETAESLGLPTSAYRFVESFAALEEAVAELDVPCIIKPDAQTSGRGHVLVKDKEQLADAWMAITRGTDQRVVVEQFVDFDYEVTILAVRSIDPATGELATWFSEVIGYEHQQGNLVESWQPAPMSPRAFENARSVAARISNELGGRGVYAVELFVAGDDVYFSSVTPRPSDKAMLTVYTQRYSQYDLHARAILGLPIDVTLISPGAACVLHASEYLDEVAFYGLEDAMRMAETDVRIFGKTSAYPGRRMGLVGATANDIAEARDRAALAHSRIRVGAVPAEEQPTPEPERAPVSAIESVDTSVRG
ncbi:MAG: formate-dependent phosphoribosylglycinamide formyltransferase [Corynebacterium sp.]|nr:formate-dependent phosphoribosylglycinamide formyltransferase [Corynebacterium sp.]